MTRGPGKDAGRTGRAGGRGARGSRGAPALSAGLSERPGTAWRGRGRTAGRLAGFTTPRPSCRGGALGHGGPGPRCPSRSGPPPPGPQVGLLTTPPEPSVYVRPRCADAGGVKGLLRGEPGGRRGEGSSPAPRRGSGPGTRRAALGGDAFLTVLVGNLLPPPLSQIPLQDPRSHAEGASPPRRRKGR